MFEPGNLFPVISLIFAVAAAWRGLRSAGKPDAATRTWLLMAAIFGAVSMWLRLHR